MSLIVHVDSGNFTLDLTGTVDTDDLPSSDDFQPISSSISATGTSSNASPTSGAGSPGLANVGGQPPLKTFEKLIVAHAIMSTMGFLILLPLGGIIARWGRTFSDKWFYYHWKVQVLFGIPVVVIGWALGPLSVAEEGVKHANDAHKVCGHFPRLYSRTSLLRMMLIDLWYNFIPIIYHAALPRDICSFPKTSVSRAAPSTKLRSCGVGYFTYRPCFL